jgi:dTDP-4-amino-4,6-dideoxygalactose transaminase
MAAILIDIKPGDEVIAPSYTFVSTVNAFVLRGATIVFCDSKANHPNIDEDKIEALITPKTKAIIPVHYAGSACDMDKIMTIANKHNLFVIEDAAQAIGAEYTFLDGGKKMAGTIGTIGCTSFFSSKNLGCYGDGGACLPMMISLVNTLK